MTWRQGVLEDASIAENTTGNTAYGESLIRAMEDWNIPEIHHAWSSALPIQTAIKGSDDPAFANRGILTGKVIKQKNEPVPGARVILDGKGSLRGRSDTLYTNREGIFIQTLIMPGKWMLNCSKPGFETLSIKDLEIMKGSHSKQELILKQTK
jgi:hypothetical protein